MITFVIDQSELTIDLLEADKAFSAIESECGARGPTPTAKLLGMVAEWIISQGIPQCSLSAAWQVWWAIYERIDHIRKQAEIDAEIAFWFHVNPFTLTAEQRVGLLANMPRVKAQSRLHNGQFDPTDYRGAYALTLLATGDKAQADRAKANALERYVDAKMGAH